MPRFSETFGIQATQPELDFVDIELDADIPLFVDPYAISIREDAWSTLCKNEIISFFQTAIDCIRRQDRATARRLLNGLAEPNETHLGLSSGVPRGRGVSGKQAIDLYEALAESRAAETGLLSELAECDLFVPGIGHDKVSDITTNIIRRHLIAYTQDQCRLHGVDLRGQVASGRLWNAARESWEQEYTQQPFHHDRAIILVPKFSVRRRLSLDSQEYYNHHILNFIKDEELNARSSLVKALKNGNLRVYKKDLRAHFPFSKEFLAQFSQQHPRVLDLYKQLKGAEGPLPGDVADEGFEETLFATALLQRLNEIEPGSNQASDFHRLMVGTLEFIFYPHLIYPIKELEIHEGRKRIDISFTNAASSGFFYRVHTAHQIASQRVMVECKNYSSDPENPEIDQLSGRFSVNRGKLGLLICREIQNPDLLWQRCHDTAVDGRGFMLPFGDREISEMLMHVSRGERNRIDQMLDGMLGRLLA